MKISPIIEVDELLQIDKHPNVMIFDASSGENAKANYEAEHLAGAFFVDLETQLADINEDAAKGGRHPLPNPATFAQTLGNLGITQNKHVIIYDDKNGANAAARFWWMLKAAGHEKVQVLDGGFNQAKKQNLPLSAGMQTPAISLATYPIAQWILPTVEINEVEKAAQSPSHIVVDVRDKVRYDGITEPIDLIAGHIPGAINIPFTENLDENGLFLKPQALKNKYQEKFGEIKSDQIVIHCGSGVTACHTLLALAYAEMALPNLYVGSWSEWSRNDKPIGKTNA